MRTYHTKTAPGELSPFTIVCGAPGRVRIIGRHLSDVRYFRNKDRGILCCTGYYNGIRVSAAGIGMGVPTVYICDPELRASGAVFRMRQGSGGSTIPDSNYGDPIIVTAAYGWDGSSVEFFPDDQRRAAFTAMAQENYYDPSLLVYPDPRLTEALQAAVKQICPTEYHVKEEGTTSSFWWEQGRMPDNTPLPPHLAKRHEKAMRGGIGVYSMEAAGLFTMPLTSALNSAFALRHISDEVRPSGEDLATEIHLVAISNLANQTWTQPYLAGA